MKNNNKNILLITTILLNTNLLSSHTLEFIDSSKTEVKLGDVLRGDTGGLDLGTDCSKFTDSDDGKKQYAGLYISDPTKDEEFQMKFHIDNFTKTAADGTEYTIDWATGDNDKPTLSWCQDTGSLETPVSIKEQDTLSDKINMEDAWGKEDNEQNLLYFSGKVATTNSTPNGKYTTTLSVTIVW